MNIMRKYNRKVVRMISLIRFIKAEALRQITVKSKYKSQLIGSAIIFTLTYVFVILISDPSILASSYSTSVNNGKILLLIGYIFWNAGVLAMDTATDSIELDSKMGTLETELQSPYPYWLLVIVRCETYNLFGLILYLFLFLFSSYFIQIHWLTGLLLMIQVALISLISNLGMIGIGLLFGALSIRVKRLGQWISILQTFMIFIGNIIFPVTYAVQWMLPFASGINISRSLFMHQGVSLLQLFAYIVLNLLWLGIGIVVFDYSLNKEREYGSFERF